MFASLKTRRTVFAAALVTALVGIPAIASAATGASTRENLAGPAGYCQPFASAPAPSLGKAQIATTTATDPGFHPVTLDVRVGGGKLAAGSYGVWLVNLYRDDAGQIIGCSASQAGALTVKNGPSTFHGSVDRYTGRYEVQVYVGSIGGPGYATAPVTVDVP
ncbi:MAG: hypothetical protein ACJ744_06025 [Gaiellaceae bacterium]|jgi:hypothetical protein